MTKASMTIEEEYVLFTQLVGEAIAMWSAIEHQLMTLVGLFFEDEKTRYDREAVAVGYLRLESFRAKLAFADAIVMVKLPDGYLEEWTRILDRLQDSSAVRNKIAHYFVMTFETAPAGRRFALQTVITTQDRASRKNAQTRAAPGALCSSDVLTHIDEFAALWAWLQNFAARICEQPEPQPGCDGQVTHPMTIRDRLRLIHAELGHPLQSSREKRQRDSAANAAASLRRPIVGEHDE